MVVIGEKHTGLDTLCNHDPQCVLDEHTVDEHTVDEHTQPLVGACAYLVEYIETSHDQDVDEPNEKYEYSRGDEACNKRGPIAHREQH